MELATWILVIFLSIALLVFLVVGIILMIKMINLTKEANKVIVQSQGIAEKADDIADNVRDMTTVGGLVKHFVNSVIDEDAPTKKKGKK